MFKTIQQAADFIQHNIATTHTTTRRAGIEIRTPQGEPMLVVKHDETMHVMREHQANINDWANAILFAELEMGNLVFKMIFPERDEE